jgi:hypothetical protein
LNPRSHLPRRVVRNVLRVSALEIGDPLSFAVLVKADDSPWYRRPVGDHSSQRST